MTTGEVIALIKALGGSGGGGSSGGVLEVHDVDGTLDKTWQEIHDAKSAKIISSEYSWATVSHVSYSSRAGKYLVGDAGYEANSPSDYPAIPDDDNN